MNSFYKKLSFELSLALIIIIVLMSGWFFFRSNIETSAAKIAATKQELANRSAMLQSFALIKSQYTQKAQAYLDVLHAVVPVEEYFINFSKELQQAASRRGLEYGFSFTGEERGAAGNLGAISFSLNLRGSQNNLIQFIQDLQTFRYVISIQNIAFDGDTEGAITLKAKVYFR